MPCQNVTKHPIPKNAAEMTCGTQMMSGEDVQANQKREMGRMIAPTIMGGKRSSGIGLPCLMYARLKFVAVEYAIKPVPIAMPTMNATKGRELTPRLQPRSSWKEIGN